MAMRRSVTMRIISRTLTLLCFVSALSLGCGHYHTTSRGRTMSGTVAVPFLDNRTNQPNLEVLATEALINAFDADGLLSVVNIGNEDYVLSGIISRYSEKPFSIGDLGAANEYRLSLSLTLSFDNSATGESIFKDKRFSATHNFYIEGSAAGEEMTREDAEEKALEKIVDDILNTIFGDW
ncbi:MAG: LptE family protein [bacterium]|nr:LptE family protein [bacterium]